MADIENADEEIAAMFDLSLKKKKKKKTKVADTAAGEGDDKAADGASSSGATADTAGGAASSSSSGFELDPPIYTYSQLLNRVVDAVHQNNPELANKTRLSMKPPQLMRGKSPFAMLFKKVFYLLLRVYV